MEKMSIEEFRNNFLLNKKGKARKSIKKNKEILKEDEFNISMEDLLEKSKTVEYPLEYPKKGYWRNIIVFYKGLKFDSKFEFSTYLLFIKEFSNETILLQKKFVLIDKFEKIDILNQKTEKFGAITYTPDFVFPDYNIAIDTKGHASEFFKARRKLFEKNYPEYSVYIVSEKNVKEFISTLSVFIKKTKELNK